MYVRRQSPVHALCNTAVSHAYARRCPGSSLPLTSSASLVSPLSAFRRALSASTLVSGLSSLHRPFIFTRDAHAAYVARVVCVLLQDFQGTPLLLDPLSPLPMPPPLSPPSPPPRHRLHCHSPPPPSPGILLRALQRRLPHASATCWLPPFHPSFQASALASASLHTGPAWDVYGRVRGVGNQDTR